MTPPVPRSGQPAVRPYRGRIAPSPTGWLHAGHARTFTVAWRRANAAGGTCILRMEDLDTARCKPVYAEAVYDDLRWLGLNWEEGPDTGGPHAPYVQSERGEIYRTWWNALRDSGCIYPSPHSRKDVREALSAPHGDSGEAVFPARLRPPPGARGGRTATRAGNWRVRGPDDRAIRFTDGCRGDTEYTAGRDFGDFIVWRKDGYPSYEFAVVVDDHLMGITEVVRGEDLLLSTARQQLLYEAFGWSAPAWYHCTLVRDADGRRLAKRTDARSLRAMRLAGVDPVRLCGRLFASQR
ncbi:MAG: tRNA glutamyl-Q synthetase [Opitutales bacterium]|nr:tRNA glutamyl-Q synthetase [Opitutales bacterium]